MKINNELNDLSIVHLNLFIEEAINKISSTFENINEETL